MAKMFEMIFHVKEGDDTVIIEALRGTAIFVSMKPVEAPKKTKYENGKRLKGITGEALAIQILSACVKPISSEEMKPLFLNKGFSKNSISPVLSKLMAMGRVGKNGSGYFLEREMK